MCQLDINNVCNGLGLINLMGIDWFRLVGGGYNTLFNLLCV